MFLLFPSPLNNLFCFVRSFLHGLQSFIFIVSIFIHSTLAKWGLLCFVIFVDADVVFFSHWFVRLHLHYYDRRTYIPKLLPISTVDPPAIYPQAYYTGF